MTNGMKTIQILGLVAIAWLAGGLSGAFPDGSFSDRNPRKAPT